MEFEKSDLKKTFITISETNVVPSTIRNLNLSNSDLCLNAN